MSIQLYFLVWIILVGMLVDGVPVFETLTEDECKSCKFDYENELKERKTNSLFRYRIG